jgi:ubiquinone/menaquinone biosynthesis C-methylase UbiE
LICFEAPAQNQWKDVYLESAWTERDEWQRPNELIRYLNIREGGVVADIGCHEGYMTFKLAAVVGNSGKVYAVDVEQGKLDKLAAHISERETQNVIPVKGDYDNPRLEPNAVDAVIIVDSYHEMDNHDEILQHIKTALKPGGRLLLCEPIDDKRRTALRDAQERKHELAMHYALTDLQKAGFKIIIQKDPFIDRTAIKGDKMWLIVAGK